MYIHAFIHAHMYVMPKNMLCKFEERNYEKIT